MRILLLALLLPLFGWAQKEESFGKFIREDGTLIKGSSVAKFYERQVPLFNLESNASANSTTVRFTMNQEAAVGILRDLSMNGKKLRSGEFVLTYFSFDRRQVRYKINMENVEVTEVTESNGSISVLLNATRIGWTYYTYTKSGLQSISSKNGWDAERRTNWTSF